jgi:hypothetical protein
MCTTDDMPDPVICERGQQWAVERTVLIYVRAPGGDPVPRGSGVLLKIAEAGFVLSAAHVLDGAHHAQVVLGGYAGALIHLRGVVFGVAHDKDDVDVAFMRLPDEAADALGTAGKKFLRLNETDFVATAPVPGQYTVVGLPQQFAKRDPATGEFNSTSVSYTTVLYPAELDSFTQGISIALICSQNETVSPDGELARLPDLHGISGGWIWRLYGPNHRPLRMWEPGWIRLAAIEHTVVAGKAIKGTLLRAVIAMILKTYPELRRSIQLSFPG